MVYSTAAEQLGHTIRKQQDWFNENDEEIQATLNKKHDLHRAHQNDPSSISKKAAFIEGCPEEVAGYLAQLEGR